MQKIGVGVGVMIMRGDKVLLGLRNPDKKKASSELQGQGTWTMPGGKVDFGETLVAAARRELLEETGLVCDDIKLLVVQDDIIDTAHYVTVGFLAHIPDDQQPIAAEPEAILEWRWFSLDALPENLYPASKKVIEKYNLGVVYQEEVV